MENWRRTCLKRLEQELEPYRIDSIFLNEEGTNPDTLRQMFDAGQEDEAVVVMDMAIFVMEDGRQLMQIFTEMVLDVDVSPELLEKINEINLLAPLGVFGYFGQERQIYHKYNQIVEEPADLETFVAQQIQIIDIVLACVQGHYGLLREITRQNR